MKRSKLSLLCASVTALLLASSGSALWAQAAKKKPTAKRASVPTEAAAPVWSPLAAWSGRQIYLGPTGARGWVGGGRIVVTVVPPGSPAEGRLQVGDSIIEAGGEALADGDDPRRVLGEAITRAETKAGRGRLVLTVVRAGLQRKVTVPIRVMGSYAPTWPYNCRKSAKILAEACDYMTTEQFPDGHIEGEGIMATAWSVLTWMAADDVKYADNIRRAIYHLCRTDYAAHDLRSWALGYGGIAITEYYLATGDETVLPKLKEMIKLTQDGQMPSGTWGHNCPWGAYGGLNQAGLVCWMMLSLSEECGLAVNKRVVKRATNFFARYVGRGGIPYGDHLPTSGAGSNGKDALGAVGFYLRDMNEAGMFFSRLVAAAYEKRENGHTGCFLSLYWGPVAASKAGEEAFRRFMDYQKWYYDLVRTPEGGIACQPNAENLGGRTTGVYTYNGPRFTTGGMALAYAIPKRAVRVLGGPKSVFGRKLTGPIAEARGLYRQRNWKALAAAVGKIKTDGKASAEQKRFAAQLAAAAERQRKEIELTLAKFDELIAAGDAYYAHEVLESLKQRLGADAAALGPAIEKMAANTRWVQTGRQYYEAWGKLQAFTWQSWHYYGQKLAEVPGAFTPPPIRKWAVVAATSETEPQTWRQVQADAGPDGASPAPPAGWAEAGFDDSKWTASEGALRVGGRGGAPWSKATVLRRRTFESGGNRRFTRLCLLVATGRDLTAVVYLNGTAILRVEPGPGRGYAKVELSPTAGRLLKKGTNVLAIQGERGPRGSGSFDVGIVGLRRK